MINSRVLPYIKEGKENAITRDALRVATGLDDRRMREEIEDLKRDYPICNDQDGKGYYIAKTPEEAAQYVKQEEARAMRILLGLRAVRAKAKEAVK